MSGRALPEWIKWRAAHPLIEGQDYSVDPETGCWEWLRTRTPTGYGFIRVFEKTVSAHRLSYELFVGPIPAGLEVHHTCRNRGCIRPAHLEAVTRDENMRLARKTHCLRGHALVEENLYYTGSGGYRRCRVCKTLRSREYEQRKREKAGGSR